MVRTPQTILPWIPTMNMHRKYQPGVLAAQSVTMQLRIWLPDCSSLAELNVSAHYQNVGC
jgi:hypothetical protein